MTDQQRSITGPAVPLSSPKRISIFRLTVLVFYPATLLFLLTSWFHWAHLCYLACWTLFSFVLLHASLLLWTCLDCVYLIISPWLLWFYCGWVGYIVKLFQIWSVSNVFIVNISDFSALSILSRHTAFILKMNALSVLLSDFLSLCGCGPLPSQ